MLTVEMALARAEALAAALALALLLEACARDIHAYSHCAWFQVCAVLWPPHVLLQCAEQCIAE